MSKLVMTIDVEDWFCVSNMTHLFPLSSWDSCEQRIHQGLDFVLEEMGKRNIKGTFFVLGWIAEKFPEIVGKIVDAGHEVAAHSYSHQKVLNMSKEEFKNDLRKCQDILKQQIAGRHELRGFRAPSFSITTKNLWALQIIKELGFSYDSSIYPIRHPDYGIADFSPSPCEVLPGLMEIPMAKLSLFGWNFPISGGGFFRLYPYALYKRLLQKALQQSDVVLYFHPWEFDPDQPRIKKLHPIKKFRHYLGLKRNRRKFVRLLNDFQASFAQMSELQASHQRAFIEPDEPLQSAQPV